MLTRPVALARELLLQRERRVKLTHDVYLIREVREIKLYFYPSAGG